MCLVSKVIFTSHSLPVPTFWSRIFSTISDSFFPVTLVSTLFLLLWKYVSSHMCLSWISIWCFQMKHFSQYCSYRFNHILLGYSQVNCKNTNSQISPTKTEGSPLIGSLARLFAIDSNELNLEVYHIGIYPIYSKHDGREIFLTEDTACWHSVVIFWQPCQNNSIYEKNIKFIFSTLLQKLLQVYLRVVKTDKV